MSNFAFVNAGGYSSTAGSTSIPLGATNVATGNLLVALFRWEGGGATDTATATVADTAGNTYELLGYCSPGSGEGTRIGVFYCLNAAGNASNSVTATLSASREYRQGCVAQYSYDGEIQLGETGVGSSGTDTTTVTSSPALTAADGDLVIGALGHFNSAGVFTPAAAYTGRSSNNLISLFDAIPSGAFDEAPGGTYSGYSGGDSYVILTAVFESIAEDVPTGTSGGLVIGSETSFVGEGFVGSIEAEGSGYTLTAAAGTYTLTGQAATLQASRLLAAAQGSYGLSGQDAALRKAYPLTAAQGSYALTGQPAGLAVARVITAAQGSYALTGIAANLVYGKTLAAEQGTYSLSGQAAGVRLARVMAASQGSYTLSGQPAGLRATRTLTAAQGAYTLSGQTANLFAARRLTAEQGAYTLTGIAAGLIYSGSGPVLIAGMGGYSLTGQAAALRRSAVLTAAQGAYALDGQPAGLVYGKRMAADAGGYTITGQAATLRTARVLAAATGFYTLDGQPANLVHSGLPFEPEAESATGGWAHYFRAEQAALRRKHLRALAEEADETREREALAEALETALIADGTATQGDVDRLRLDQIAALYTDRTLLDRRAQRALAYAERSRTELATRLALRELQRQQEDEELAVLLVLAID